MGKFAMSPAGATAFLVFTVGFLVYAAALTIWSHIQGTRVMSTRYDKRTDEERKAVVAWIRRISRLYGVGWAVVAYGVLAIGVLDGGWDFVGERVPVLTVWAFSPLGVYVLAYYYWTFWSKREVPATEDL
jgi:hypothetical protein